MHSNKLPVGLYMSALYVKNVFTRDIKANLGDLANLWDALTGDINANLGDLCDINCVIYMY